ncbi:MAG: universal stress protein UspE [Succinivibrionaceae bacterium]|nr:universal stress protein UspE [Succinivibrionaceae bacterium]
MKKYRNILLVLDAAGYNHNALEKAFFLAKRDPEVKVTVFLAIFDFSYELSTIMSFTEKEEMLSKIIDAKEAEVEQVIREQGLENKNLTVKVVWARSAGGAMGRELKQGNYDLIIKACAENGVINSFLQTPIDWKLLRKAKIPVILVKEKNWEPDGAILVALCFTELGFCNRVNRKLLREAQILSKITGCRIHLVNAVHIPMLNTYIDVPGYLPSTYNEAVMNDHAAKIKRYADDHRIPLENIHVRSGSPEEVIPRVAEELDAVAVIMGCVGRDGFSGTVIGNTAEMIMDEMSCDLIVIKTPEELFDTSPDEDQPQTDAENGE